MKLFYCFGNIIVKLGLEMGSVNCAVAHMMEQTDRCCWIGRVHHYICAVHSERLVITTVGAKKK